MPLTEFQRDRINFHLDLDSERGLLRINYNILESAFSEIKVIQLVGDLTIALPENKLFFEGIELCTVTSALGKVELTFANLGPAKIDDSLLVKSAGKVDLRSDELKAREKLYQTQIKYLKQLVGMTDDSQSRAELSML